MVKIKKYKIYSIAIMVFFNLNSNAQSDKLIPEVDFIIGDYGISFKNKKIGKGLVLGYYEIPKMNFEKTSLYIVGKKVLFIEDQTFDVNTLQAIETGKSWKEATKRDALYYDKNGIYRRLFIQNKKDYSEGFTLLKDNSFTKNNELYFAESHGFYRIENSQQLDFDSIKQIVGQFFMDKNGFYFAKSNVISHYDDTIDSIEFEKVQEMNVNPQIKVFEDYCIINKKVYALQSNLKELELDYNNIQKLDVFKFDGAKAFSDNTNIYYRYMSTSSIDKVDCSADENELYCIEKDFSKIELLRETGFTEYHYDIDKSVLYFDTYDKEIGFTETSGDIYKISDGYYFQDHDRFSERIKEVKIWNPKNKAYENLDIEQYKHIFRVNYYYKGNLYGHHSELIHKNFNIKALKVLKTYKHYYISDDKIIVNFSESDALDLAKLEVLKMPDGEPSDYLTDGKSLVYDNQLIENFENIDVNIVNQDLIITKNYIYSKGEVISRNEFKIPIKFLSNEKK